MKLPGFPLRNPEPEVTGGGPTPAPAPAPDASAAPAADTLVDLTAAPAAPAASPAPTPAPEPFEGLNKILDSIGVPQPTPAPTPAPTQAPAPGATPAPTPAPQMDLTPPDGMNERTAARWTQLTERVKQVPELERQAREATTALDNVRRMVADSGLAANEFTDMLETGRLLKSADPKELQQALQRIDNIRAQVAQQLGVELPGIDPLAAHADLKAEVEAMTLTKERALEIAKLRGKGQQADAMTAEQRDMQQFQQSVTSAAASMEATLKTREGQPGHDAKLKFIHGYFSDPQKLQSFVTMYKPHQWEAVLLTMYDTYSPPSTPAPPAVPQPLRPGNTRAGAPVSAGPVTAESAVEGAFARLGL